jgi:hypothetical protein
VSDDALPSDYYQTLARLNLSHSDVQHFAMRMFPELPTDAAIARWLRSAQQLAN